MAERRMFAKTIIDSDAFLDMSASAQALYFHLGMRADDDGFVNNPKKIQRIINASDDDLKILFAKRFIIGFETGVIVIKHWKMHNYIQRDRYKPTVYQDEKARLFTKDNKSYTEKQGYISDVSTLDTVCIQDASSLDTQVRLGKDSVVKDSKSTAGVHPMFDAFWQAYPKKVGKADALKAFAKLKPDNELMQTILAAIAQWSKTDQWSKDNRQYVPMPATYIRGRRWEDELPKDNKPKENPIIMLN